MYQVGFLNWPNVCQDFGKITAKNFCRPNLKSVSIFICRIVMSNPCKKLEKYISLPAELNKIKCEVPF